MKHIRTLLTTSLALMACAVTLRADLLPPVQDTSSAKAKLSPAGGKASTLAVSATSKAFVLFNLESLPVGVLPADIANARLRVYFPKVTMPGDISITTATQAWTETAAGAEPTVAGAPIAIFPSAMVVTKKFIEVDVTATVRAWRTTPADNFGFAFTAAGITKVTLGAKEGAGTGYPAELEVQIDRATVDGSIGTTQLGSNLTLGGTTTGTFSGSLAGNAATATSATTAGSATTATTAGSFTGALAGNVTGTQGATVVASVGGVTAANVATGANLANAATDLNTANAIVKRDAGGSFEAGNITSNSYGGGFKAVGGSSTLTFFSGVPSTLRGTLAIPDGPGQFSAAGTLGDLVLRVETGRLMLQSGAGDPAIFIDSSNNVSFGKNLFLPGTNAAGTTGVITQGGNRLIHTFGNNNFFAGLNAGNFIMAGNSNTGLGNGVLSILTSGNANCAIGVGALGGNTTGSNNTIIGFNAMPANQTGDDNTAVGLQALIGNTGSGNIALGRAAGFNLTTGNGNICIGNGGNGGESNTIRIGAFQQATFIAGINGATSSGGVAVFINGSGQLGTVTSSRRFKTDIADMSQSSEMLHALRPVTFHYKPELDAKGIPQWGLIAEEVNEVNPDLVVRDDQGVIQTVRYEQVNAMLLNEFLKDHRRADARDVEIAELKQRIADLEAKDQRREAREQAREARLSRLEGALDSRPARTERASLDLK